MRTGAENRKKTIWAGALGAAAVLGCGFTLYNTLFADNGPTPPPTVAPLSQAPVSQAIRSNNQAMNEPAASGSGARTVAGATPAGGGVAAGVDAQKMATASASLDPTLDESAMLRTEHLVYSGAGRNIFSAIYTPPVVIPTAIAPARRKGPPPPPVVYVAPAPVTCPPTCPPINLKFFGTATRPNGVRQAFLLQADNVFLASQGDIVARRYRIVSISANSIQVEDMENKNTQTLPLAN